MSKPSRRDLLADVLSSIEASVAESGHPASETLVHVPALIRMVVEETGADGADVRLALLDLARAAAIELRPESGVGLLSKADAKLCPKGIRGDPLSYLRLLD